MAKIIKSYDELPAMFDIALASILTGFEPRYLRQLCRAGKFPAFKIGRDWRIDKADFINWKNSLKEATP